MTADLRVALLRAYIAALRPQPAPAPRVDTTGRPTLVYLRG